MYDSAVSVLLWIIAGGISLFVVTLGFVLSYHWIQFAMNRLATIFAIISYILVASILLLALFGAAASYSLLI